MLHCNISPQTSHVKAGQSELPPNEALKKKPGLQIPSLKGRQRNSVWESVTFRSTMPKHKTNNTMSKSKTHPAPIWEPCPEIQKLCGKLGNGSRQLDQAVFCTLGSPCLWRVIPVRGETPRGETMIRHSSKWPGRPCKQKGHGIVYPSKKGAFHGFPKNMHLSEKESRGESLAGQTESRSVFCTVRALFRLRSHGRDIHDAYWNSLLDSHLGCIVSSVKWALNNPLSERKQLCLLLAKHFCLLPWSNIHKARKKLPTDIFVKHSCSFLSFCLGMSCSFCLKPAFSLLNV